MTINMNNKLKGSQARPENPNHKTRAKYALALASLLLSANALAGSLLFVSDDRRVNTYSDTGNTVTMPPGFFSPWSSPYQSATFYPILGGGGINASGSGYGYSDYSYYIQTSTFDVTFDVVGNIDYVMQGTLEGNDGDFGIGGALVSLVKDGSTTIFSDYGGSGFNSNYFWSGKLGPGSYQLIVDTDIVPGESDAYWTLDASYTSAVPVPAAAWLFASGLVALTGIARRNAGHKIKT